MVARIGGDIAGNARRSLEAETKKKVVSSSNFLPKKLRKSSVRNPSESVRWANSEHAILWGQS